VHELLKAHAKVPFNVHFYAGTLEEAKRFFEIGGTISFTGVVTFAKAYEDIIKAVPLDKMHAETDCPFVAPIPYRGQRCEPQFVIEVYKKIAELKNVKVDVVRQQLIENANMVGSSLLYGALIWIYTIDIWLGLLLTATIVIIGVILWRHHHINIRLKGEHLTLHMRCWLKAISYCFFAWTLVGIGFFIIAFGIDGTPRLLSAISASSTAIGSGMLAIFAPGGIGVREVIFYYFGFSASVIIIWRCITFVIDIIIGIVAIAMIRRYR
jgi:hypothetical protein